MRQAIDSNLSILFLQLQFLVHLLDVTGPYLDKMVRLLNVLRSLSPIDKTTYMGKTTIYTKPKGTVGLQNSSIILAQKDHPTSEPNNGAPIAAPAPAVHVGFPSPFPPTVVTKTPPPHIWTTPLSVEQEQTKGKHRRSLLWW